MKNTFKTLKEAREFLKQNLKRSINLFDDMICRDDVKQTWYGGRIVHTKRFNPNFGRVGNSFEIGIRTYYGVEERKAFLESYNVKLKEEN